MGQDEGAEAAAGECRMDEDGADFGGVGCGIEEFRFAVLRLDHPPQPARVGWPLAPGASTRK